MTDALVVRCHFCQCILNNILWFESIRAFIVGTGPVFTLRDGRRVYTCEDCDHWEGQKVLIQ